MLADCARREPQQQRTRLSNMATSSLQGCRFRDPQSVIDLTCTEFIVRLLFQNCDSCALYAHSALLCAWSGVLRHVLEDVQEQVTTPGRSKPSNEVTAGFVDIPLDDSDTAAWEEALALMHPSRQLFKMSWESAARLLLLARKYDMPAVTAHVEAFLMEDVILKPAQPVSTPSSSSSSSCTCQVTSYSSSDPPCVSSRLAAHLSPDNATDWLQLTSISGLDPQAGICIKFILQHQVLVDSSLLSSIQPQHADQLLSGLQQQLQMASTTATEQEQTLATAALPIGTPTSRARCPDCKATWYKLPDGKSTPHCFSCGKRRPIILGELYQP